MTTATGPDLRTLRDRVPVALAQAAAGAAARERHRILPHEQIRTLADAGLFTWRIPTGYGGPGAGLVDAIDFAIDLATADPNIAQAVRVNFVTTEELLLATGPEAEADRQTWFGRLLNGAVIGNAGNEVGGVNGAVTTTLVDHGDHYRVTGRKFYSTGALFADWIRSTAVDDRGRLHGFTVPADRSGIELIDDWDAMGQRLTASGTTLFTDLRLEPDEVRAWPAGDPAHRPALSPLFQVFLAAVEVGIARNAVEETASLVGPRIAGLAELDVSVGAARAGVLAAAATVQRAYGAGGPHQLLVEAATDVARAQFFAINTAIDVSDRVFDLLDDHALDRATDLGLDRHWRNARTLALHSPRAYKASMVGRYELTGEQPPTSGLF